MKSTLRILIVAILLAVGGGSGYWYLRQHRSQPDGQIRVSGNIEATEAQVAFKIAGRVEKRLVDEGDFVEQGAVIATLETGDLAANIAMREADVDAAQAALDELKAGSRAEDIAAAKAAWEKAAHALADLEAGSRPQEIAAAEAALAAAEANVKRLDADFRRATTLFQRRTISAEEFDAARDAFTVAVERQKQAREQLKLVQEGSRKEQIEQARSAAAQAKAQYDVVKAGPRIEDKRQGEARLKQAQAALQLAQTQYSYATIYAPLTGVVLSKNIEPGEYVAPGTAVVTVGDIVHVWLRAYVEEADKGRVKWGQRAWVTTDTEPGKRYEGKVSFISSEAEFTPKNVQTQKERVKLVYRIKIDIYNPHMELKPGMPADAVIEAGTRDERRGVGERKAAAPAASTRSSTSSPRSSPPVARP
ncbi:MAG: efflux RND transporter periplasmic adaptor subunit [Thermoguttaceae bacterium]